MSMFSKAAALAKAAVTATTQGVDRALLEGGLQVAKDSLDDRIGADPAARAYGKGEVAQMRQAVESVLDAFTELVESAYQAMPEKPSPSSRPVDHLAAFIGGLEERYQSLSGAEVDAALSRLVADSKAKGVVEPILRSPERQHALVREVLGSFAAKRGEYAELLVGLLRLKHLSAEQVLEGAARLGPLLEALPKTASEGQAALEKLTHLEPVRLLLAMVVDAALAPGDLRQAAKSALADEARMEQVIQAFASAGFMAELERQGIDASRLVQVVRERTHQAAA